MASIEDLPHRHPFRFVFGDCEEDGLEVLITPGDPWPRGSDFPQFYTLEILGQAAALILARTAGERESASFRRPGYLAGVSGLVLHRKLMAEERLRVDARLERMFGRLAKVRVWAEDDGGVVAEAELLLGIGGIE